MEFPMEICRLCLSCKDNNIYVLNNSDLLNKIKKYVSIEITTTETYSKHICTMCLDTIENWDKFRMRCLNSKNILEETSNSRKTRNKKFSVNKDCEYEEKGSTINYDNEQNCDPKEITVDPQNEVYKCEYCLILFQYYTDYLDHHCLHNEEIKFTCEKCDMFFSSKMLLVQHERNHKVTCQVCGTDVQKQSLRIHLNKHTDKYKCEHCSQTFTCSPLLKEHVTAVHMKIKQHFCDNCGKAFASRSSLLLHLKTHSDLKLYKCDECDYTGRTSVSLKIHKSKHENGTYICEYCSKIFKSNRNLRDHIKRVHQCNKKYSCELCDMRFALRYQVEQHKRTHTGLHPYKCLQCNKTFARSDGLKDHLHTHNRTETYLCQLCKKIFKTKRGLKRHNCPNILLIKNN